MSVEIDRETSGMESNSALGRCRLNVRIAPEGGPPLQGLRVSEPKLHCPDHACFRERGVFLLASSRPKQP